MDEREFLERCAALALVLADAAPEAEKLRRVPDDVMRQAHDGDVLRVIMPKSLGGAGLSLSALCEGTRMLATGCPAQAWTLSFLMLHSWMASRFPADARAELFADNAVPTAAAPLAPTGKLVPTDGGFLVTGRWEWATAIGNAEWCMLHGFDESVEFGTRFAIVPVGEVRVDDDWFTSGMRATGSCTVNADELFVPAHRTIVGDELRGVGSGVADDQLANFPLVTVLMLVASAPAVGAAEAAVTHYRERIRARVLAYSAGDRAADQPLVQARLASVESDLATLLAGWRSAIEQIEASAATVGGPTDELRARTRLASAAAVRASRILIGTVGEGAGAGVYFDSHPIQRLQRDVETLKGHVVFDWDRTTELAGRVLLGNPLRPLDMA